MNYFSLRSAAIGILFFVCAPVFSQQTAVAVQNASAEQELTVSAADITLSTPENAIRFDWGDADTTQPALPTGSSSSIGLFVRMVVALAIVAALIYAVIFLMKKGLQPRGSDDPFLRRVSQIALAPGKTVQIVTLFNHAYLVGVTDAAINVLGEITDEQLVNSLNLYADQNANETKPRSFEDILNIFMARRPGTRSTTGFEETAQTATESLQRQRERLNEAAAETGAEQ